MEGKGVLGPFCLLLCALDPSFKIWGMGGALQTPGIRDYKIIRVTAARTKEDLKKNWLLLIKPLLELHLWYSALQERMVAKWWALASQKTRLGALCASATDATIPHMGLGT